MATTSTPVGSRDKSVAWYTPTLSTLSPETKKLLQEYSRIPEGELLSRIYSVRDKAWDIWPYPCIGQFRFLTLALPHTPSFSSIVSRLRDTPDALFLDLGCCFGQDLRALAAAGAPGSALVGVELHGGFHDMGKAMFRDGGDEDSVRALDAQFIEADLFSDEGASATHLRALAGKIDVLQASAFLHMFTWERQREAGVRIVRLMKAEPGVMVVGTQVGSAKPGLYEQGRMYLHDVASFDTLWGEIGRETGSQWKVVAELAEDPREKKPWDDVNVRKLNFEITRVA